MYDGEILDAKTFIDVSDISSGPQGTTEWE